MEIDLSDEDRITTKAQLSDVLRHSVERMRWINNTRIEDRLSKAQNDAKEIMTFLNKNVKTLKVYGKKRVVYCPRFKVDVDKVNADDVCTRACCCFVRELESYPDLGDEPVEKKSSIQCVGHIASQYFQLIKIKGNSCQRKDSLVISESPYLHIISLPLWHLGSSSEGGAQMVMAVFT